MQDSTPSISSVSSGKYTKYRNQLLTVRDYLTQHTASRYMTFITAGGPLQNIFRNIDSLIKVDQCHVVRKDKCKVSGEIVEFLSCNPDLWPTDTQLKLFNR